MRLVFLIIAIVLVISVEARVFSGSANITYIIPTETMVVACTSEEKYTIKSGETRNITLRIRNPMENKTLKRVDLEVVPQDGLIVSYSPKQIHNIMPGERGFFYLNVTAPDVIYGNYRIDLYLGTDEYDVGANHDELMIKVRPWGREIFYIFSLLPAALIFAVVWRYIGIKKANRLTKLKQHKRKSLSMKYYKN